MTEEDNELDDGNSSSSNSGVGTSSSSSFELNDNQKRMIKFLENNPNQEYTYKQLGIHLGLNHRTIYNWFWEDYDRGLDRYCIKKKKGTQNYIKLIQPRSLTILEELAEALKSDELYAVFEELFFDEGTHLGIHHIRVIHRDDPTIRQFYDDCDWRVSKGISKQKIKVIKGKIEDYGETYVLISRGEQTKKPSIEIHYKQTLNKDFLTQATYPKWFDLVNSFIHNVLERSYGLDNFAIFRIEINYDVPLKDKNGNITTINKKKATHFKHKAIRVYELNKAIEIYTYDGDDGVEYGRIGREIETKKDETLTNDFKKYASVESVLSGFNLYARGLDKQTELVADKVNRIEKGTKALINDFTIIKDNYELMRDHFWDYSQKFSKYQQKLDSEFSTLNTNLTQNNANMTQLTQTLKTFKEGVKNGFSSLKEMYDDLREDFKTELGDFDDRIEEQNKLIGTLVSVINGITNTQDQNTKILSQFQESFTQITILINSIEEKNEQNLDLLSDKFEKVSDLIVEDIRNFQTNQNQTNQKLIKIITNQQTQMNQQNDSLNQLIQWEKIKENRRIIKEKNKSKIRKFFERLF